MVITPRGSKVKGSFRNTHLLARYCTHGVHAHQSVFLRSQHFGFIVVSLVIYHENIKPGCYENKQKGGAGKHVIQRF